MALITPLLKPFAYARVDNVLPAFTHSSPDDVANQQTGFPLLQAEDLDLPGATPVKETEMNGILNFYSNYVYNLGLGNQFTFNASLSSAAGGYPLGAILFCPTNNTYQRSLVANNTANFIGTPSYINDGVHWATVTATPSINNPTLNFLDITCISNFNVDYTATFLQTQITSGDITNGHMLWYVEAKDNVDGSFAQVQNYYNVGTDGTGNVATQGLDIRTRQYNNTGSGINQYLERTPSINKNHIDILLFDNFDSSTVNNGLAFETGTVARVVGNYDTLHKEPNSVAIVKNTRNGFISASAGSQVFVWSAQRDVSTGMYHVSITGIKTELAITSSNQYEFILDLAPFGFGNVARAIGSASSYPSGGVTPSQVASSSSVDGSGAIVTFTVYFANTITNPNYAMNFQASVLCGIIPT